MKSKLEIYALAVCFAAVVCLVISLGIAGYAIFEVTAPELTMSSYRYSTHQNNEAYWDSKKSCAKGRDEVKPDEDTLTKQRLDAFAEEAMAEKRGGIQTLLKCLMFILASATVLLIHLKIAQKSRAAST